MVSGIECAGVVLAALPLFVEAGKAYTRGFNSIQDLALPSRRDSKLEEFYEEFYWEMVQLDRQVRGIVDVLPFLSNERKTELTTHVRLEDWNNDGDIVTALREFFGSDDDFNSYLTVMTKVLQLLAQLIKDSTVDLDATDLSKSTMYQKLKEFGASRASGQTSSSFRERFKFWKREKDRNVCIRNLRTWNKRLLRLTDDARRQPAGRNTLRAHRKAPSSQLRVLCQRVYSALYKCWSCSCSKRHEAKFCLRTHEGPSQNTAQADIDFEFLFSASAGQTSVSSWQEGTVLVRTSGAINDHDRAILKRICDALQGGEHAQQSLHLLVEEVDGEQTVWRLRSQPRRIHVLEDAPAVALHELLGRVRFALVTKRRLAVIFAHMVLHLHESLWLGREWNKGHISFFYQSKDQLDYQRPYLSTRFDKDALEPELPDMSRFHRNPTILALGILLIEIETERPIESYRTKDDLSNGQEVNPNTDWLVADRVVQTLDNCSLTYRRVIEACLNTPWIQAGQRVSLEDPVTRACVYEDVVKPLEEELAYMLKDKV